ncbi:gluconate 2-dehydrogenase subunit 3 family protein [Alteromonas gilva]|uniref:Gluconate 2-dehydrogenase subunit 3 family protein n=1 Tax=Alteromonas gilva TaxID=2987522 RepID=A0ABT5KZK4_9ALTE|nr:gluconate 2-dehydrogenase subunit 3 family protein [Alteromonas gilva]MDC8830195.1 gluconate 2-dehydrogenase subunit 3 family protein [Alteromonas gilva]
MINRRQLLKVISTVAGSAVASTLLSAPSIASSATFNAAQNNTTGRLFSTSQLEALRQICQLTIPATSTPGAADVNCHHFIDHQLRVVFPRTVQDEAVAILKKISAAGDQYGDAPFENLSPDIQIKLLTDLEAASGPFTRQDKDAFKQIKGLIVFGYYTSLPGATKELTYLAVPGEFKGSVALSKVGSAYSSKAYY